MWRTGEQMKNDIIWQYFDVNSEESVTISPNSTTAQYEWHNEHVNSDSDAGVAALDDQHDGDGHLLCKHEAGPQGEPVEQEIWIILVLIGHNLSSLSSKTFNFIKYYYAKG